MAVRQPPSSTAGSDYFTILCPSRFRLAMEVGGGGKYWLVIVTGSGFNGCFVLYTTNDGGDGRYQIWFLNRFCRIGTPILRRLTKQKNIYSFCLVWHQALQSSNLLVGLMVSPLLLINFFAGGAIFDGGGKTIGNKNTGVFII
ncbi:conserved hypothetical protein [Ricinus communis]|uniref:Uncharacterized protein n=1 Tax=Ricinus communis TaxID=3988 RepID=B9T7T5_RICCO|nr:conserved hypothetical protein [Ricinus communis]